MVQFADFLLDSDGDLLIQNGDFVVGASDIQHVEDIIESFVGEWKQYPILGVGLMTYLKSQNGAKAITAIKQQLQSDGYSLSNVKIDNTINGIKVSFPNGITRNE